ncbi:hypothetical protein [Actomonas aquatica]|uniref:Signal peptidase I n=1 Tax=Actomonas aquatica TaxID=2866162 RepID=A0ABZ1C8U0_9BACT|nr:hypothetical protein [Opitutus sp. WL0086]WRQ88045.1 hypothetical protein K1X11_001410 [Opitutus sp. WL0086]
MTLEIETGNLGEVPTSGTGWAVGFSPWTDTPGSLRHVPADTAVRGLCLKWKTHQAGDPQGINKPVSSGRTLSVLVSAESRFRIEFASDAAFTQDVSAVVLKRAGDFVAWGAGVHHRWEAQTGCTMMTLRWEPDADGER